MMNYDQEVRNAIAELLEAINPKHHDEIAHIIETLRYYADIRTQMIDGLMDELQRLKSNYRGLISEVSDDDDYFESESMRERVKRERGR